MELNEAISELEEHGYLLNEWKATPDFDELSPEDKVTLTKAMNGAYTARKSGNAKNLAKYSAILNDIASKMKNASAIKKIQKMVGKMGPSDGTTSAPAPTPKLAKKAPKTVKLVTVQTYHDTGYKYETDWFDNLRSASYKVAQAMVDKLKADYNGSSIRNEISFRLRDDHDGEEGYYEITATIPDYKVDELKHAWTRADEYADVKVLGAKDAEHKAEKPKKPAEIWFEKYKDRSVQFKILGLQCYAQKFVHGEPTDFVIINKSGVKNSKVSHIYKGSDENAKDALHQAIKKDKFTNHVRVDARKEETPWEYITWLTPFGKAELVKTAKIHPEAVRIQTSDGPITDIPTKYVYAFIEQYIHE